MGLEEYKGVYVFAQQVDNELSGIAFELLGKAKELASDLGTDVTAVLIGSDVKGLTDELAEHRSRKDKKSETCAVYRNWNRIDCRMCCICTGDV